MDKDLNLSEILNRCSCILLDIEGTITSVDFVRNTLYNYAQQRTSNYIREHWNDELVQKSAVEVLIKDVDESKLEEKKKLLGDDDPVRREVHIQTFTEQLLNYKPKTPIIKSLEGAICEEGFLNGDLQGHIYPDVLCSLKSWKSKEKKIYIYSNGSVSSQRLLLKYSIHGDISQFIDGHFDTTQGSKLDPPSYESICNEVQKQPKDIVFFSDRPLELLAAKRIGMQIVLVVRDETNQLFETERKYMCPEINCPIISSFSDISDG